MEQDGFGGSGARGGVCAAAAVQRTEHASARTGARVLLDSGLLLVQISGKCSGMVMVM